MMNTLATGWRRISRSVGTMRLRHKVLAGYVLMVLIPICVCGPLIYSEIYNSLLRDYSAGKQRLVEQAYANLDSHLRQIESYYSVLQYNQQMIEWLGGTYATDTDATYYFLRYIRPLFSYIQISHGFIDEAIVYKSDKRALLISPELRNLQDYPRVEEQTAKLLVEGLWTWHTPEGPGKLPALVYYRPLYNDAFTKKLGVLAIEVRPDLLEQFLQHLPAAGDSRRLLADIDGRLLAAREGNVQVEAEASDLALLDRVLAEGETFLSSGKVAVNTVRLDRLGLMAVVASDTGTEFGHVQAKMRDIFIIIVALLLLLSGIYYVVANSLTRRIMGLAQHMRRLDGNNLTLYAGRQAGGRMKSAICPLPTTR